MSNEIILYKYPRTPHLEGSRLQPGDEDLSQIPFSRIKGRHLVVEEKCDGANTAVSFDHQGRLLLQSRGHYLTGGYRERHYDLLKQWASVHQSAFYEALGARYVMYGEWMYAKHTVYYDALPHFFLEFDILDRQTGKFLDTHARRAMLEGLPVVSVPVLAEGRFQTKEELLSLLGPSRYITRDHRYALRQTCGFQGIDPEQVCAETEDSMLMEGLYLKIEEDGQVVERLKYVRHGFTQAMTQSGSHWLDRPIVPNGLTRFIGDLFGPELPPEAAH